MDPNGSSFRLSATQPIARGLLRPMLKAGRPGTRYWFSLALLVSAVLPLSTAAQSPEPDPRTAGSDVIGKITPASEATSMVGIPAAHQQITERIPVIFTRKASGM